MASVDDEGEYEVERVLAERARGKEFKIKWLGFPVSEATWEPAACCAGCEGLVAEFRKQRKADNKRKAAAPAKPNKPAKPAKAAKTAKAANKAAAPAAAKVPVAKKKAAPAKVKPAVAAKTTAAACPTAKVVWFVEVCTYCSGVGCYFGTDPDEWPDSTEESHGPYASEALAEAAARDIRRGVCQFDCWEEVFAEDGPPPWNSGDMENMDEDENVIITIVSSAALAAVADEAAARAAKELKKAAASVPRPAPAMRAGGKVGLDTSLAVREDIQLFVRHPSALEGGKRMAASAFPKGFVHMIQRLSDMCYSVAAYCTDPNRGARYALKKYPRIACKSVVWVPPPGCGLGGLHSPAPATVIDCVHTDLIESGTGQKLWTGPSLLAAASRATTVMFLNEVKEQDAGLTIELIQKCSELQVIVMVECDITPGILGALATRGQSLLGVHMYACDGCGLMDEHFPPFLSACNGRLLWLCLSHGGTIAGSFGEQAWDAVPGSVRVLELPCKAYGAGLRANLEGLRVPMTNALRRLGPELAYLMVARDMKGKSCVEKQGSGGSATVKISVK